MPPDLVEDNLDQEQEDASGGDSEEDDSEQDSSDGDDDAFDQFFEAMTDAMADAQAQALAELDLSKLSQDMDTIKRLLRQPYIPPVEGPDEAVEAPLDENNDDQVFNKAIGSIAVFVNMFDGDNPLHSRPIPEQSPDTLMPPFLDILSATRTHVVSAVPSFLALIHPEPDAPYPAPGVNPTWRSNIIQLICGLFYLPPTPTEGSAQTGKDLPTRLPLLHHLPALLSHLRNGDVVDRSSILGLLEGLSDALANKDSDEAEDEETEQRPSDDGVSQEFKDLVVDALQKTLFLDIQPPKDSDAKKPRSLSFSERISILQTFENVVLMSRTACIDLFLTAGAYDWAITQSVVDRCGSIPPYYAQTPPDPSVPKVLLAAQSCLAVIHNAVKDDDDLDAQFSNQSTLFQDGDIRSTFQHIKNFVIFNIVQIVEVCQFPLNRPAKADAFSEWQDLLKACAEFLNGAFMENPKLRLFLALQDDAVRALIMTLGRKDPGIFGIDAEWLFARFCQYEDGETPSLDGRDTEGTGQSDASPADDEAEGETGEDEDVDIKANRQIGKASRGMFRGTLKALLGEAADKPWSGGLEFADKLTLLGGFQMSFPDIQTQAMRGGITTFIINTLTSSDVSDADKARVLARTPTLKVKLSLTPVPQKILDAMMENAQTAGYYLLQAGIVAALVSLLATPALVPAVIGVFSKLLDSYSPGDSSKSQRSVVAQELTSPNVLPTLSSFLDISPGETDGDRITAAGSTLRLLADMVSEETGTESWGYDEDDDDPPPPCPLKDLLISTDFLRTAFTLLALEPETIGIEGLHAQKEEPTGPSKDALHFLCQGCWGYQRGYDLTVTMFKEIFAKIGEDEELWLFNNLYGSYSGRADGRMRRRVASAAVAADGLSRAYALMEREARKLKGGDTDAPLTCKRRRAAVEALRVVLCVGTDLDQARHSDHLASLISALLLDVTRPSLDSAFWMVSLLSRGDDFDDNNVLDFASFTRRERVRADKQRWLLQGSWKNLGSEAVAQALASHLQHQPFETNSEEPPTDEEALERHTKLTRAADGYRMETVKHVVNLVDIILPVLGTHSIALAPPLFTISKESDDDRAILSVIQRILFVQGVDTSNVVALLQSFITSQNPPSCNQFKEWIEAGPLTCDVLRQAGVVDHLLRILAIDKESSEEYVDTLGSLAALGAIVDNTLDPAEKEKVQRQFVANPAALANALKILYGDDEWDALTAVTAFGKLCKSLPTNIDFIDDASEALPRVLKLFDTMDFYHDSIAPLLGQLAPAGPDKIVDLIKSYFADLHPPEVPTQAKGKKNKKKKKHTPRIGQETLWERLALLAKTTAVVRKALVDAGVITEAVKVLRSDTTEEWQYPLPTLSALVSAGEGYESEISSVFPRLEEILPADGAPCSTILGLVDAFVVVDAALLKGFVSALLDASCDYPLSFDPHLDLPKTIQDIASKSTAYPFLLKHLQSRLDDKDVIDKEIPDGWRTGFAASLKRIASFGQSGRDLVLEAGAVDYAIKLLHHDEVQVVNNGGRLSAFLADSKGSHLFTTFIELGVLDLLEKGRLKALQLSERPFSENTDEDVDEETFEYICKDFATQAQTIAKVIEFFNSEGGSYSEDEYGTIQ
ncbi:hypothetical protein ONZ45_g16472 [Pleurotus djamor]|nr:hypothetical protein ONZ45_g16472 [Pleurotus djamor]